MPQSEFRRREDMQQGGTREAGGFLIAELSNVSTEDNERERPWKIAFSGQSLEREIINGRQDF